MREIAKIKKSPYVKVGFQGVSGERQHDTKSKASITDIATFNEFGTISKKGNEHIPARPFVRTTIDDNLRELLSINAKLLYQIGKGSMTTEQALKILGLKIQALMQKKVTDIKNPPNASITIKRKGSSNPLIDTGRMRQAITFVIEGYGSLTSNKESGQYRASGRKMSKNKRVAKSKERSKRREKKKSRFAIRRAKG